MLKKQRDLLGFDGGRRIKQATRDLRQVKENTIVRWSALSATGQGLPERSAAPPVTAENETLPSVGCYGSVRPARPLRAIRWLNIRFQQTSRSKAWVVKVRLCKHG